MSGNPQTKLSFIKIMKRAAIYFISLDLLAFFYYSVGNGQNFLAETQLMLLRLVSVLSASALISALAGGGVSVVRWIRRDAPFSFLALAGWLACIVVSVFLAFFTAFVRVFAEGI